MGLIEPDHLTSHRMFCHCLANLRRAQLIAIPLNLHSCSQAILLNLCPAIRLEDLPPGKVECVRIIPDVHHLFPNEFFSYRRIDLRENSAAVGDWRFTSLACRLNTEKADYHGPLPRVRHLVMKHDGLMSR